MGQLLSTLGKAVQHWWTGHCELSRLCRRGTFNPNMSLEVCRYLKRSKALAPQSKRLYTANYTDYSPLGQGMSILNEVHLAIVEKKDIPHLALPVPGTSPYTEEEDTFRASKNLRLCLIAIIYAQRVKAEMLALRMTAVDRSIAEHEATLERVWEHLRPGVRRAGGAVTEEWGECGFQGKDPGTDFRGGGLLSLQQLAWLAEHRGDEARAALTLFSDPGCYVPFAATSINFSAWCIEMLAQGLCDRELFDAHFEGYHAAGLGLDEHAAGSVLVAEKKKKKKKKKNRLVQDGDESKCAVLLV